MEVDKSLVQLKVHTKIPKAFANSIIDREEDVFISNKENFYSLFTGNNLTFIFKLAAYLHEEQMYDKAQLNVFDNTWMSLDKTSSKTYKFKYSNFISTTNNTDFKKNLKVLAQTNTKVNSFYIDANGDRQDVEIFSTIISDLVFIKNQGFKFSINYHWLRKFLDISGHYRPITTKAIFSIKYKHTLVFYLWISALKDIGQFRLEADKVEFQSIAGNFKERVLATRCKIQLLNKLLGVNCDKPNKVEVILKKIKAETDSYCDRSFNYSYNPHTKKFSIVSYELNNSLKLNSSNVSEIDPFDLDSIKIRKAINYRIKKQELSAKEALALLIVFLKYSFEIVSKAISNKEVELYKVDDVFVIPSNDKIENTGKVSIHNKKVSELKGKLFVDVVTQLSENYCTKNKVVVSLRSYTKTKQVIDFTQEYLNKIEEEDFELKVINDISLKLEQRKSSIKVPNVILKGNESLSINSILSSVKGADLELKNYFQLILEYKKHRSKLLPFLQNTNIDFYYIEEYCEILANEKDNDDVKRLYELAECKRILLS